MGNADSTNVTSYNERAVRPTLGSRSVRPSQLRFTHDSIGYKFRGGYTLENSLRDLLNNKINVQSLPRMEVMHHDGHLYVVRGNRRLYLLQKLEKFGLVNEITVYVRRFDSTLFDKQHTTDCGGAYVRIRGRQNTDATLELIIEQHVHNERYRNEGCIIL
ncbi:uncharacterized protein LOC121372096 [Gigantopelta aegis]|uniref:uncharacterized protein LOC121372096 n=1 Tax=Gigantopelta aegis TaxID=1735272 RepID=UPI001B88A3FF|nr:uncharacterized protein LOC121372096 [Gigantopelta aegis]